MKKLFISTLGFEEIFLIRFLLRNQPLPGDIILIISPFPDESRSIKAYQEVESFLAKYMPEVKLERIQVPVTKIYQAIMLIVQKIRSLNISNAIVNLSGGMRILVIEVLAAVKMVLGDNADVEVELEDRREIVRFKPSVMDLRIPTIKQIRILSAMMKLGKDATLSKISNMTKIPRSSVYKEIKRMKEEGFVTRMNSKHFTLTDLGFAWAQGENL